MVRFSREQFDEAKRVRAELRLALAHADELMRRAEAVLLRSAGPESAMAEECSDQARSPAMVRSGL